MTISLFQDVVTILSISATDPEHMVIQNTGSTEIDFQVTSTLCESLCYSLPPLLAAAMGGELQYRLTSELLHERYLYCNFVSIHKL